MGLCLLVPGLWKVFCCITGVSLPVMGHGASLWTLEYAALDFTCSNLGCDGEGHKEGSVVPGSDGCVIFLPR